MKKWEYTTKLKFELIGHGDGYTIFQGGELDKALNDMGNQGWELVATEKANYNKSLSMYYFKREKK